MLSYVINRDRQMRGCVKIREELGSPKEEASLSYLRTYRTLRTHQFLHIQPFLDPPVSCREKANTSVLAYESVP